MSCSIALQQVSGPWFPTRSEPRLWPFPLWTWEDFLAKSSWEHWKLPLPLPNYLWKDQSTSYWDPTVRKWIFLCFCLVRAFWIFYWDLGQSTSLGHYWIDRQRPSGDPYLSREISLRCNQGWDPDP